MNIIINFFKKIVSVAYLPRWIVFLFDLICVGASFFIINSLLDGIGVKGIFTNDLFGRFFVYLLANAIFLGIFRVCVGVIRHSTFKDVLRIAYSQLAVFLSLVFFSDIYRSGNDPKMFLTTRLLLIILFAVCVLTIYRLVIKSIFHQLNLQPSTNKSNLLIYGAGSTAVAILNILANDTNSPYNVKALFKIGKKEQSRIELGNIPVVVSKHAPYVVARKLRCNHLLIADETITSEQKKKIVDDCLDYRIKVLYFPEVSDWSDHKKVMGAIQQIRIEDLLERKEIKISNERIGRDLKDKVIMITGAAGSIGGEIVTQVLKFHPSKLILVDQAETPLHSKILEIAKYIEDKDSIQPIVGDVRDYDQMENLIKEYRPEIIYHAAAYKHVPLMEENPFQAVYTNVLGTRNLADLASKYKVQRFVMVSTDKAVNPSNVMGASKRIAEKYVLALSKVAENETKFITTRFGNVLGSNGSVVPLFTKQIEEGGPITITHPEIIRYFMTIPEACQLVLEAGSMGNGGEVFVFDMGEPVKIINLAKKMIRLAGLTPDIDIKIKEIGLREGEKLFEELLYDTAQSLPTHHEKILIASDVADDFSEIREAIDQLLRFARLNALEPTVIQMKKIVPEFKSLNSKYEKYDEK